MGKVAIAVFGLLFLLQAPSCRAQQLEYNRHLLELQRTLPQWRAVVLEVDANRLNISYQGGKVIEQGRRIALQNLETANLLVSRILVRRHLADEISLFGLLGEVNSSLNSLDQDLLNFAGDQNQKTVAGWTDRLVAITDGPLSQEQIFQLKAVTAIADTIEARCSPPAASTH